MKNSFLFIFRRCLLISGVKSLKKVKNKQKRFKIAEKKYFDQLLGVRSTQKLVQIHNISYQDVKNRSLKKQTYQLKLIGQ